MPKQAFGRDPGLKKSEKNVKKREKSAKKRQNLGQNLGVWGVEKSVENRGKIWVEI